MKIWPLLAVVLHIQVTNKCICTIHKWSILDCLLYTVICYIEVPFETCLTVVLMRSGVINTCLISNCLDWISLMFNITFNFNVILAIRFCVNTSSFPDLYICCVLFDAVLPFETSIWYDCVIHLNYCWLIIWHDNIRDQHVYNLLS